MLQVQKTHEEVEMGARSIRKDGFLFRLAYFLVHENKLPKRVSLCVVVWRAAASMFSVLLFGSVTLALVGFAVGGFAMFLWTIAVALYGFFSDLTMQKIVMLPQNEGFWVALVFMAIAAFSTALVGFVVILPITSRCIRRWLEAYETTRLILAYLKAKKEKVCPMYDVV